MPNFEDTRSKLRTSTGKRSQGVRAVRACAPPPRGTATDSAAARRTVRMSREQKRQLPCPASGLFCLPGRHATETAMTFLSRFWRYSLETYGGAPVLLIVTFVQLTLLAWVIAEGLRARAGLLRSPRRAGDRKST